MELQFKQSQASFSKAPEMCQACKVIFNSSVSKNREEYMPKTSCMKRTSVYMKNMSNRVWDFATAFWLWKHFGTFEKWAWGLLHFILACIASCMKTVFVIAYCSHVQLGWWRERHCVKSVLNLQFKRTKISNSSATTSLIHYSTQLFIYMWFTCLHLHVFLLV